MRAIAAGCSEYQSLYHKAASVAFCRQNMLECVGCRVGPEAAQQAAEVSACPRWSELPAEVLLQIFGCLDATSLAMAACVRRAWHQVATSSDWLWSALLQRDSTPNYHVSLAHHSSDLQRYRSMMTNRLRWYQGILLAQCVSESCVKAELELW